MATTGKSTFTIDFRKEILLVYQPVFPAFTPVHAVRMGRLVEAHELHKYVKRLDGLLQVCMLLACNIQHLACTLHRPWKHTMRSVPILALDQPLVSR